MKCLYLGKFKHTDSRSADQGETSLRTMGLSTCTRCWQRIQTIPTMSMMIASTGMAGKVIREGKGEGMHAEQRWQAKRASRIHKRSGAALRGRVMSPCSKHTFVCAYFYVQLFLDQAGSWAWG